MRGREEASDDYGRAGNSLYRRVLVLKRTPERNFRIKAIKLQKRITEKVRDAPDFFLWYTITAGRNIRL